MLPDEELQEVSRRNDKNTMPDNGGNPVVNALPNREPVKYVSHAITGLAIHRDAANRPTMKPI